MNKEQILNIVEKLAKDGYKFQSEENRNNSLRERAASGQILLTFKDGLLDLCVVRIRRNLTAAEMNVNF